jgi:hypothetical protein
MPRSCASCDETGCDMHKRLLRREHLSERVSWVLDDCWPESASMIAASFKPTDQLIAPGLFGAWPKRYNWPVEGEHIASFATAWRHLAMRQVAKASGAVRQRTYLDHDRILARRLAKGIDYRARHLVVAQAWLPWLDELGIFGGRTFDVVMNRYPFGEIHRLLDGAATELGPSATIADFRAPTELVQREAQLLSRARFIFTPHHGIAALFPDQAVQLAWHVPPPRHRKPGNRVLFLGPTIARQRPDIAARLAKSISKPLIVFGCVIEPLWEGVEVEVREKGPNWLDGVGAVLHPAALTHEPRALIEARASGVSVYATETCGLAHTDYLTLDRFGRD